MTGRLLAMLGAEEKTDREAGKLLGISVDMVQTNCFNLMRKPEVHDPSQLVRYSVREGISHTITRFQNALCSPQTLLHYLTSKFAVRPHLASGNGLSFYLSGNHVLQGSKLSPPYAEKSYPKWIAHRSNSCHSMRGEM